ncbi:TetR/AcrR family transcriptional regulator [Pseudoalteromonas sp. JBTF-M23]|uniref:TetR/AcrR family transcriptional regulator n=1 Tax=Pseudoalteromonas caenipelagi TaxID=2726988 RepID=A0A849V897_9GAMM|nr:TetR/AcrR family transcriptional regulator [Pseudoalteromonas caenipelagi]NOU49552.1 TetR/AcrR family transcriptional regulator [Pseudoalteromonas caenipelagi]
MRSAEFDKEYVLRQAMRTFMQYGYSKTSMQKLTEATGLHPGSIYCAFKNKKGLLLASVEQYQQDKNEQFEQLFAQHKSVRSALEIFLQDIVQPCASNEATKVCLLTRTLSEVDGQDDEVTQVLSNNLCAFEQALQSVLSKAQHCGEISATPSAKERAQFLVMGIYGLRTYASTSSDEQALVKLSEQLLGHVLQ